MAYSTKTAALLAAQRRAEHELLEKWVVAYLTERGPSLYSQIVTDLNCKTGQLSRVLTKLRRANRAYTGAAIPGRNSKRIWSLNPIVRNRVRTQEKKKPASFVTQEDLAWMDFYRKPRHERRQLGVRT